MHLNCRRLLATVAVGNVSILLRHWLTRNCEYQDPELTPRAGFARTFGMRTPALPSFCSSGLASAKSLADNSRKLRGEL